MDKNVPGQLLRYRRRRRRLPLPGEKAVSTPTLRTPTAVVQGAAARVLKITSLNGNTATVETAVHHAYDLSCCVPWVQKLLNR